MLHRQNQWSVTVGPSIRTDGLEPVTAPESGELARARAVLKELGKAQDTDV